MTPPPEDLETIWLPLGRADKLQLANSSGILFSTDSELNSFDFMLKQFATHPPTKADGIFVRTQQGLRVLNDRGELVMPDGKFRPNYIKPVLNEDPEDKQWLFNTISNWVGGEEAAHSLLHHLATALAPNWSAVKYVILLGEGRNGKSVLLSMLADLFGKENVSNVSRQQMAEQAAACIDLNAKLINIVFDGRMDYIRDSGMEKSLIAGEPGFVRMLYESHTTEVQTNALFVEALNQEPKSRDKTSALQKRLVRFRFSQVFERDIAFERKMSGPEMLGALLSLLIEHYVCEDEVLERLAPAQSSLELQLEQTWLNLPMVQYILKLINENQVAPTEFVGKDSKSIINGFMSWRLDEGLQELSTMDSLQMLKEQFELKWKTTRDGTGFIRQQIIAAIKPGLQMFLDQLTRGEDNGSDNSRALVED